MGVFKAGSGGVCADSRRAGEVQATGTQCLAGRTARARPHGEARGGSVSGLRTPDSLRSWGFLPVQGLLPAGLARCCTGCAGRDVERGQRMLW